MLFGRLFARFRRKNNLDKGIHLYNLPESFLLVEGFQEQSFDYKNRILEAKFILWIRQ